MYNVKPGIQFKVAILHQDEYQSGISAGIVNGRFEVWA